MNRVKYVPADIQSRRDNPMSALAIRIADGHPDRRGDFMTAREADEYAIKQGWVKFSTLSAREKKRWNKAAIEARTALVKKPPGA